MREEIDKIHYSEPNSRNQSLERLHIIQISTHIPGNDCENYALGTLGLYRFMNEYRKFMSSLPKKDIFEHRYIDFLLVQQLVEIVDVPMDNSLLAYWHSCAPASHCSGSGLPHYSHYGICRASNDILAVESKWGMGGNIYLSPSVFALPTLYGDQIHSFRPTS